MKVQEKLMRFTALTQKDPPRELPLPGGSFLGSTTFAVVVPIKPFAGVIRDNARSYRHQKVDEKLHHAHLLLLPGFERQHQYYTKFDRSCQRKHRTARGFCAAKQRLTIGVGGAILRLQGKLESFIALTRKDPPGSGVSLGGRTRLNCLCCCCADRAICRHSMLRCPPQPTRQN